eukprot:TRINITY_DN16287_c0_g2_i1.p1 TRINITY_DN16287_c0_g2~~TRINITY_DN16287_c0_g2_i1.p1  ORF type:complete len:266 (-),score=61.72 TRINITY_DN16287_c0_g2_i1:20-817(-)
MSATTYVHCDFKKLLDLSGQVAIVTGGATGIGFAIVRRLLESGATVVIADLSQEALNEATTKLQHLNLTKLKALLIDVTNETQVQRMVDETVGSFGRIDILVNNAGIYPFSPFLNLTLESWNKVLSVNITAAFLCSQKVAKHMVEKGIKGKIINITSTAAIKYQEGGLSHYGTTKHGLLGLTRFLAAELAADNIVVNAVAPGKILVSKFAKGMGISEEGIVEIEDVPMKRLGLPDEIGKVVLFLASPMSTYQTGAQVVVDGGASL